GEQHPQPPIGNDKARNDGSHRKPYSDNTAIDGKQTTSLEKKTTKGADGKKVTEYAAFGEADDITFRTPPGEEQLGNSGSSLNWWKGGAAFPMIQLCRALN
ncbi:hypothetical protein P0G11_13495, partial [Adlercreutzia rubneri]|uniref:hypothetical protein n=1 Tax=Adlercreutzia rubneri TaxID=2916441 RepID=UPI0023AEB366